MKGYCMKVIVLKSGSVISSVIEYSEQNVKDLLDMKWQNWEDDNSAEFTFRVMTVKKM